MATGLAIHLNRIFNPNSNNYVDLRNPNRLGEDYLVFDFDEKIYPTDEARMLSRIGLVDLSIRSLENDLDHEKISLLNQNCSNFNDPACKTCAYQPYCGVDNIDKLSRYQTIKVDTFETHFCKVHMGIFDYIFKKIAAKEEKFLLTASLCLTGRYEISSLFNGVYID